ncbi:fasciclin domain-containing protein [Chitinophaga oryziterrae]|uniref:Fasciclin domain-containing protein n=1 Tax=Chitinophaga oryziterrae TaxID=1031224 RepID=A0A6N8J7R8_9BACT|nr:fasciclin domain-containing protein [Chitinophaga oryziterrae]MVT41123.1 fasciclin domain-containing protein [Chitinophaga oryziterrae]
MSNITQVVNTDKNLKTLKKGVHSSDLDQLLSSTGPFTLFAPSDIAFEKLEKGLMDDLLEPQNKLKLTDLMNNHIVSGIVPFKNLKDGDSLTTINGNQLIVEIKNGKVNVGGAGILLRDAKISNGIMYATDIVFVK